MVCSQLRLTDPTSVGVTCTISTRLAPNFGNFIDNTSLALHKFQAKSEVFPKRIENVNRHKSIQERSNFLFSYAVAWCGSDLTVGLVTSVLTDPTCGGATCTVSTPCRCHGYRTAGVWCQPQMNQPLPPGSPLGTLGGVKRERPNLQS